MTRLRIGVVGCGAIAQIQHLPNLVALDDLFEVTAVCDLSATLATAMAQRFGIATASTDLDDMLDRARVDAILLCQTDPKIAAAQRVLTAGKHLFIEKPVAFVPQDVDDLAAIAASEGLVAQAGYMKLFDPAFERMAAEVDDMRSRIRFVQINHLHTSNAHHLAAYDLLQAPDIEPQAIQLVSQERATHIDRALGETPHATRQAFLRMAGSMIHDLYGLRALFGPVQRVVGAEFWNEGEGISTLLDCGQDVRCAATWVELADIRYFHESLEVYGDDRGLILTYPTGFSHAGASLHLRGPDADGNAAQWPANVDGEIAFVGELRHFHSCVTRGVDCRASLADARHDVQLVVDITQAATP